MGSGMKGDGEGGRAGCASVLLRFVASLLSIAGLLLLVKDNETANQLVGAQSFTSSVKYSYTSAFLFLVYSNGLVALYCCLVAVSSILCLIVHAGSGKLSAWIIFVLDQALAYILIAAASASTEVTYLADHGNVKTSWQDLCSVYAHFCVLAKASVVLSFLSAFVLACISVMSARRLFRKYVRCTVERKHISNT